MNLWQVIVALALSFQQAEDLAQPLAEEGGLGSLENRSPLDVHHMVLSAGACESELQFRHLGQGGHGRAVRELSEREPEGISLLQYQTLRARAGLSVCGRVLVGSLYA